MAIMIKAKIRESPTNFKKDLKRELMALLEGFKPIPFQVLA
jgi:hypothetical protein